MELQRQSFSEVFISITTQLRIGMFGTMVDEFATVSVAIICYAFHPSFNPHWSEVCPIGIFEIFFAFEMMMMMIDVNAPNVLD